MIDPKVKETLINSITEINAERKAWCDAHGVPMPEPIETLDLIMKKEFALQILKGEKNVEFRSVTQHYQSRLFDKKLGAFLDKHTDNEEIMGQCGMWGYCDELRPVKTIHFHNYNNDWYLDVEVLYNGYAIANKEGAESLHLYDCYDLDVLVEELDKKNEEERPVFFIFIISKVIATNLEV